MYNPSKIIWIKNVKRNYGEGWAYANTTFEKPFLLNWSTSKPGSAKTPGIGDIIVLFQKPNTINGRKNRVVHFTHLVTPISDKVIDDFDSPDHKWAREVKLLAIANPIESIPNPGYFNFFKPNRGLTNPIKNLTNTNNFSEEETKKIIWELFQNFLNPKLKYESLVFEGKYGEIEGDKIIKEHIKQEIRRRNSKIVQQAKSDALVKNNGHLSCECCDFDFLDAFGQHGSGFIECHHRMHISLGERITTTNDLVLVCSNCHRMLHRRNLEGKYFLVEELKQLILSQTVVK